MPRLGLAGSSRTAGSARSQKTNARLWLALADWPMSMNRTESESKPQPAHRIEPNRMRTDRKRP
eukprot:5197717-Pyramimonas_sp.AAC.1